MGSPSFLSQTYKHSKQYDFPGWSQLDFPGWLTHHFKQHNSSNTTQHLYNNDTIYNININNLPPTHYYYYNAVPERPDMHYNEFGDKKFLLLLYFISMLILNTVR